MTRKGYLVSLLATGLAVAPAAAPAQQPMQTCVASVDGTDQQIAYQADLVPEPGTLDRLLGRASGEGCPPEAVLGYLTPFLTPEERAPFCLVVDEEAQSVVGFAEGERDDDLVCADAEGKGLCERVNESSAAAMRLAGIDTEAGLAENAESVGGRIQAVRDASGATIVKGATGVVSGALGSIGATGLSALTAPAAVAAATVTVVAAGGAVYLCR